MFKKYLFIFGFLTIVSMICGCGTTPFYDSSEVNKNWGRSYETALFNQLLNPDADKNLNPVTGFDGTAGENNVEKYKKSFKEAESKEITNILKLQ